MFATMKVRLNINDEWVAENVGQGKTVSDIVKEILDNAIVSIDNTDSAEVVSFDIPDLKLSVDIDK